MFRIILAVLIALFSSSQNGFCVTQWNRILPLSTDLKSAWPAASQANLGILDSLLSNYQRGLTLTYSSASTIVALPGEVVVSNALGTIRLFLVATTSTNITFTNIDTGASAASTTYYIYAGTSTATDSAPTFYISLSASAPTGVTYYEQLGSFTTDSASSMTNIINNNSNGSSNQLLGAKSTGVIYQALTDVYAGCWLNASQNVAVSLYTGSISGSMTNVQTCGDSNQSLNIYCTVGWPIRKGDYYEFVGSANACYAMATSK